MKPIEQTPAWQPGQPKLLDRVRDRLPRPRSSRSRRHHLDPSYLQKAVGAAIRKLGIQKHAGCHPGTRTYAPRKSTRTSSGKTDSPSKALSIVTVRLRSNVDDLTKVDDPPGRKIQGLQDSGVAYPALKGWATIGLRYATSGRPEGDRWAVPTCYPCRVWFGSSPVRSRSPVRPRTNEPAAGAEPGSEPAAGAEPANEPAASAEPLDRVACGRRPGMAQPATM
jgi:hypothetical protein